MPTKFHPIYSITPKIAKALMRIEAVKEKVAHLPLTPTVLTSLRETARLYTTHYSTMIEGNKLAPDEIKQLLSHKGHFPGRTRDEKEVKGYYNALAFVEQSAAKGTPITEAMVQKIHSFVMADGQKNTPTIPYRDGQNVIRDARTHSIVYLPPEAKDVSPLMKAMVTWIRESKDIPTPIIAGIAHYQFATIHPYYDGNGHTARLLTTTIMHEGGYDLKGLYSLEEYYARNLGAYYDAIGIGPSHNYYEGRAQADITSWVEYFTQGAAAAFENVLKRMDAAKKQGEPDQTATLRSLDPKQRKALELFQQHQTVTAKEIGALFGFKPRTSAHLCKSWVEAGFLEMANPSNKGRTYRLAKKYAL